MQLKTIILEGFKSYGKRTEISGFDPQFTAITGLNGTGKSNILDAICFVMGITNLGQVRASTLQELVYKNGQAGIIKATVTLVFDNKDPEHYPIGYPMGKDVTITRQVVVGGKNRYLINGRNVPNKTVTDLFCSIKLNVNNPNFLIMQGRITKVLNMKPIEILSMVEEAAGTSVYDSKRNECKRMIAKKGETLTRIQNLLKEEIEPKLNRLRNDLQKYNEYKAIVRDIETLTRISISYQYKQYTKSIEKQQNDITAIQNKINDNNRKISENSERCQAITSECNEMKESVNTQNETVINVLDGKIGKHLKTETISLSSKKVLTQDLEMCKRTKLTLMKSIKDDGDLLKKKKSDLIAFNELFQNLKDSYEMDNRMYVDVCKKFEALNQGLLTTNDAGVCESLQQQLIDTRTKLAESQTQLKRNDMESKHLTQLLREKENEGRIHDTTYLSDKRKITTIENEIKILTQKLSTISYEEGSLEQLENDKLQLTQAIRQIQINLDHRNAHLFEFQYMDPIENFDRSMVKGMVCKLFDVLNPDHYMALSTVAGGSLYNVVTDTDTTSKLILERGQLQRRTTIIPMNKINSSFIHANVIRMAQNVVGETNVFSAMSCITYNREYEKVLQHIFGRTLVCRDLAIARQVAFHSKILTQCVTFEGDIVDPKGTLTGGSAPRNGPILLEIATVKKFENQLTTANRKLLQINENIERLEAIARQYANVKEQLEQKQEALNVVKERFAQSTFQQHQQEIDDLKERLHVLDIDRSTLDAAIIENQQKCAAIQEKLKDQKGYHQRELNKTKIEMKQLKQKSEGSKGKWKQKEQEYETIRLEIDEWTTSIERDMKKLAEANEKIVTMEQKVESMTNESKELSTTVLKLKLDLKKEKEIVQKIYDEINGKEQKITSLQRNSNDMKLLIRKSEHQREKLTGEVKELNRRTANLERDYDWIVTDRDFFGTKNTRYDYTNEDPGDVAKKLEKYQKDRDFMERTINVKAMALLKREEDQYNSIIEKNERLANDKQKIERIIKALDAKRKDELKMAWQMIDENLSKIFSSLLPGTDARLHASDNSDFMKGLYIKVGFKGLWKDSLTELSGGQRSLVALSLILAMLKYKPSPVYILDEVDAALDMSHTQNIGTMLKNHFKTSQFVIVSLKEGMFQNANVLFKTRFEDGVSAVSRTVNPLLLL